MTPRRTTRILLALAGLVLLTAAALARSPLLHAAGRYVVSQDSPQPADAIAVLSGSIPDRILEAVDLYDAGMAPRILLVAEKTRPGIDELQRRGVHIPHVHDLNIDIATQLGVPRSALVLLEDHANSTLSEARAILRHLRQHHLRSALVVTSKIHSHRAGVIYRWLAGDEFTILSVPSRHDPFDPTSWWHSRGYARRLIFEYQKLAVFWLRDRWLRDPAATT